LRAQQNASIRSTGEPQSGDGAIDRLFGFVEYRIESRQATGGLRADGGLMRQRDLSEIVAAAAP